MSDATHDQTYDTTSPAELQSGGSGVGTGSGTVPAHAIAYELTIEDAAITAAYLARKGAPLYAAQAKANASVVLPLMLLGIASVVVAAFGASTIDDTRDLLHTLFALMIGLLVLLLGVALAKFNAKDSWKRTLEALSLGGALGRSPLQMRVWLSDKGVECETHVGRSTLWWGRFYAVERTEAHILVLVNAVQAHVVPVRAFPMPSDAAAFFAEVHRRHEEAKRAAKHASLAPETASTPG